MINSYVKKLIENLPDNITKKKAPLNKKFIKIIEFLKYNINSLKDENDKIIF